MMSCEDIITNEERSCFGIIDSHAHYFDRRFETEVEGGAEAVLESRVFGKGIAAVINVGTNPENSIRCIEQAKKYKNMYAAVGVHPEDCQHLEGSVEEELGKIRLLLDTPEKRAENRITTVMDKISDRIGVSIYYFSTVYIPFVFLICQTERSWFDENPTPSVIWSSCSTLMYASEYMSFSSWSQKSRSV